jgi:uncharacterized protein
MGDGLEPPVGDADAGGLTAAPRIAALDIIRGVAVMGILAMNIVAFAMPREAYANPFVFGWQGTADTISWIVSFTFVDGKMRGLFSFLFGASMLLVIERAEAAGDNGARVHFARMAWLLVFGLIHFFFIWWGDILTLYAPMGMIAWCFHRRSTERLLGAGVLLVFAQFMLFAILAIDAHQLAAAAAAPGASRETLHNWAALGEQVTPRTQDLEAALGLYRGSYGDILAHRLHEGPTELLMSLLLFGLETLGYMLLGMAMLRNGFLSGSWSCRRYARIAAAALAVTVPLYLLLAALLLRARFDVRSFYALDLAATALLRPVMVIGIAALIILLTRRGGSLVAWIAATGRAAFTNYLGTSLLMTSLFYGYGLGWFGSLSRSMLWLVVFPACALMLLWSKPWLDRFRYGPFEWLWRSLARGRPQAMRLRSDP